MLAITDFYFRSLCCYTGAKSFFKKKMEGPRLSSKEKMVGLTLKKKMKGLKLFAVKKWRAQTFFVEKKQKNVSYPKKNPNMYEEANTFFEGINF